MDKTKKDIHTTNYINKKVKELRKTKVEFIQEIDNVIPKEACEYFINELEKFIKKGEVSDAYLMERNVKEQTTNTNWLQTTKKAYNKKWKNCYDVFFLPQPTEEEAKSKEFRGDLGKGYVNLREHKTLEQNISSMINAVFEELHFYFINVGYLGYDLAGATKETIHKYIPTKYGVSVHGLPIPKGIALHSLTLRKYPYKEDGGYHIPHYDDLNVHTNPRVLSMILYLNDIKNGGGETEFPLLNKKIKPKQGRLGIFPPYYTHTHYGRRTVNEDKYVFTLHFTRFEHE